MAEIKDNHNLEQIGRRIREERKKLGYTLQDFAGKIGLSAPYLSQIENGHANINISHLESIGQALNIPVFNFFVNGSMPEISLLRSSERRWFALGEKAAESLLVKFRSDIEIFVIRLEPGANTVHDSQHQGEEFSYVINGKIRIILGKEDVYELSSGDMIYYKSDISHFWENIGDDIAEVLVANTPATY
jgi:transcriptional regulator with XRE-family HTH domain